MTTQNLHRKLINYSQNDTVSFPYCVYPCNPKLTHIVGASPAPSPATTTVLQLPPPSSNHHNHHHQLLSLPLKISLIFLFATFIYTLYKFYTICFRSRRRRAPATASPENQETRDHDYNDGVDHPIWYIRTTGLSPSVINGITVVKFDKSDRVIDGTDCSVCLTEFDGDDMLRLLPSCKHAFHVSCIDTWLRSHTNCPLCRAGIEDDTVDGTLDERNNGGESGFIGDRTSLAVLVVRDGDQGEASGSSVVRIGEGDELDVNNNVSKREG